MGLDQYAMSIGMNVLHEDAQTDINCINKEQFDTFHTWRKHPDLQGWMEKLYHEKGGYQGSFNSGANVRLSLEDLDKLKDDVMAGSLPETVGFFFGNSHPEEILSDLDFIKKAREIILSGKAVIYDSWW